MSTTSSLGYRELTVRLRRPHAKQREFLDSPAKRKIIRTGIRGSKTTGLAVMAVREFLAGRRLVYGAPTEDQVSALWREVKRALAEPIDAGVYRKNENTHVIELEVTEQRIRAKTCWDADALRGKGLQRNRVPYNALIRCFRKRCGVDAVQSDVERHAQEFMEENEPLLENGSLPVVQRIFVQGAQISKTLSDETVEVANNLTSVTRSLAAALWDPSRPPRDIQELETERERLLPIFERKRAAFQRFSDFMDRVDETRRRSEAGGESSP